MGYVLDILIVAVCVVFIVVGAYRGLIRSAAHFWGLFLPPAWLLPWGGPWHRGSLTPCSDRR